MAPERDATSAGLAPKADPPTAAHARRGGPRSGLFGCLSLPARLFLLAVACVVPLVWMGIVREYIDYKAERESVYESLKTIARGTAVTVERELLLRVSALEVLAMSPALTGDTLDEFDVQVSAFLDRLPPGTVAGIITPDQQIQRLFGMRNVPSGQLPRRAAGGQGSKVFDTGQPMISNIRAEATTGPRRTAVRRGRPRRARRSG